MSGFAWAPLPEAEHPTAIETVFVSKECGAAPTDREMTPAGQQWKCTNSAECVRFQILTPWNSCGLQLYCRWIVADPTPNL